MDSVKVDNAIQARDSIIVWQLQRDCNNEDLVQTVWQDFREKIVTLVSANVVSKQVNKVNVIARNT